MPFWRPPFVLPRLRVRIPMTKPRERASVSVPSQPGSAGPRCGCCPRCRAFVRIEPKRSGEMVPCPSCGQSIGFVKPLDDDLPPLE